MARKGFILKSLFNNENRIDMYNNNPKKALLILCFIKRTKVNAVNKVPL